MREIIVRYNDGNDYMAVRGGEYVQDLVRCGECKYKFMHGSVWECLYGLLIPSPDGFCSYGEVRDE